MELSKLEKLKEPTLKKFLIFREMELSGIKIKKFLILSSLSPKKNFSYISGNKNFIYFGKLNFRTLRIKKFSS